MSQPFSRPPPSVQDVLVSFPRPHVLLVTINRPGQLNCIRRETHFQLDGLWKWYDAEPSLRCAVITGSGRAFCAGADLKEWNSSNNSSSNNNNKQRDQSTPRFADGGFGGLSNRRGKKPVVAAVNGLCLGGGMEMVLNADMVVAAAAGAKFALPEVARGAVAVQGALPRLMRAVGMQRASEMALLGRTYTAAEMLGWGLVNRVVDDGDVLDAALRWASQVAGNSPDAVIVSREGLLAGWGAEDPKASTERIQETLYAEMEGGENMREGVLSFVEKRRPVWKDSKL